MDFISFASWTGMLSLFETYFGTWHRIRQQDKAYSNIKILLYHWLLIYVHVSKPTGGRRPCDINCSKFFPAPFWSHNQKVVWVSLLYLPTKSNADYLPINSTLIWANHWTVILDYDLPTCPSSPCLWKGPKGADPEESANQTPIKATMSKLSLRNSQSDQLYWFETSP